MANLRLAILKRLGRAGESAAQKKAKAWASMPVESRKYFMANPEIGAEPARRTVARAAMPKGPERDAAIQSAWDEGLNVSQIAERIGGKRSDVLAHVHRKGLVARRGQQT